ncbi:MAG: hypothetical protein IJI27_07700 [Oscillospiraceae bacterium]|nr:hypothetical protein [Oscillospiraceae bacterium]
MDELQERLSRLLEDPEELRRMTDMASQLLGGGEASEPDAPKLPDLSSIMGKLRGGSSDTQKLLQAMKPFLAPERQARLSRAMRAAKLASLASAAFTQLGGEDGDEPI